MPQTSSEITRQSIRLFPVSNTEVNIERLPDEESRKGMELCYRDEGDEGNLVQSAIWYLIAIGGLSLYAVFCISLPSLVFRLWRELQAVEGLPMVAMMLATMLGLALLLSLVFFPIHLREALVVASI